MRRDFDERILATIFVIFGCCTLLMLLLMIFKAISFITGFISFTTLFGCFGISLFITLSSFICWNHLLKRIKKEELDGEF